MRRGNISKGKIVKQSLERDLWRKSGKASEIVQRCGEDMRAVGEGGVEDEFAAKLVSYEKEFATRLVENGEGERAAKMLKIRIFLIINI